MEVALELEDDLFFADLSRQVSLLLMDDNEDPLPHPHVSLQALSHGGHQPTRSLVAHDHATAAVAAAYNGVSKGTGVFIPRSLQPARKQRRGRYNNIKPNRLPITIDVNSQVSSNNHLMRPKKG